jgi:LacI family transcriptional regulator
MTSLSDGTPPLDRAPQPRPGVGVEPESGGQDGPAEGGAASATIGLSIDGVPVAEYRAGAELPAEHSPRPYLHPVRSVAGVELTEVAPADHPHHYGVSMAVADVDGTSHWGGRTFVSGTGSTMLDNHGRQERDDLVPRPDGGGFDETLTWYDTAGAPQLTETRSIRARPVPGLAAWALTWTSVLTAPVATEVHIGSPATNGRAGAGYGGIFWRLPNRPGTEVLSVAGAGEALAHGSDSPWLALNQSDGGAEVGLLLSQPAEVARPWFVRAGEYAGAGPMLAAESVLTIEAGASVTTSLFAVVVDRAVRDDADAEGILAAAGLFGGAVADAGPADHGASDVGSGGVGSPISGSTGSGARS